MLVDSYSGNLSHYLYYHSPVSTMGAQSFTGKNAYLESVQWYLAKSGLPIGNIRAKLYTHTGVYGVSSRPGELLAVSEWVDVSTLNVYPFELMGFTFTGENRYKMSEGVHYCLVIEIDGGDASNYLVVGADYSPSHSGNVADYQNGPDEWIPYSYYDFIFYVYGTKYEVASASGSGVGSYSISTKLTAFAGASGSGVGAGIAGSNLWPVVIKHTFVARAKVREFIKEITMYFKGGV